MAEVERQTETAAKPPTTEASVTKENATSATQPEEAEVQSFPIFVKTPNGAKIQLPVSLLDNLQDIRQFLLETAETCYVTCYSLYFQGKKQNDFHELSHVEGLKADSVLDMVEGTYDERSARQHVHRVREILNVPNNPAPTHFSSFSAEDLVDSRAVKKDAPTATTSNGVDAKEAGKDSAGKSKPAAPEDMVEDVEFKGSNPSLSEYFTNNNKIVSPQCARSVVFSGWNPPVGNRRLLGDLFYLEVSTLETKTYFITASTTGFFQNSSTPAIFNPASKGIKSHTLVGLLHQLSPLFRKNWPILTSNIFEKQPFQMLAVPFPITPWVAPPQRASYDPNRAEDALLFGTETEGRGQLRDWNEEFQSCRELPHATVQERIIRDRSIIKVNNDFVDAATKAACAVIRREVPPINPLDPEKSHMYIYNNIFLSFAVDSRDLYKDTGGDRAAYTNANNDLKGVVAYNIADVPGLYTIGTAIIDYRGHRVVAQTIIPGILNREETSKVAYGSSLDAAKTIQSNQDFHKLLVEAGKRLCIAEHTVVDSTGNAVPLAAAVESKGIVGTDGRKYILDVVRATPRDANFPEVKYSTALLRLELIMGYMYYMAQKQKKEKEDQQKEEEAKKSEQQGEMPEKKDGGESSAAATGADPSQTPPTEGKSALSLEGDATMEGFDKIKLNPNVFTEHKVGGTAEEIAAAEDAVRACSVFLKETVIPIMIEDFSAYVSVPVDGQTLTSCMHGRGINMRYLGTIASQTAHLPFIQSICFQEMITRSAKYIFNTSLREVTDHQLAPSLAHFLNTLLGNVSAPPPSTSTANHSDKKKKKKPASKKHYSTKTLWEDILKAVKDKFNYDLTEAAAKRLPKLPLLRSFLQKVGVQALARDFDFTNDTPFTPDDVLDLYPIVKHSTPKSGDGNDLMEAGKAFIGQGRLDIAMELLTEALAIFHQVYGPMHKDTAGCYANLAMVLYHAEDKVQALSHQQKAVIINERVNGPDHHDTIHSYSSLAMFLHSLSRTKEAITYMQRSLYLASLIAGPDHPDHSSTFSSIAAMLQDAGNHKLSLQYLLEALRCNEAIFGTNHLQTAATCHAIAISHMYMEQFKEALAYEKRNYNILHNTVGDSDMRTVESNIWLKQFTAKAVQMQIEAKKTQREITANLSQEKLEHAKLAGKQMSGGLQAVMSAGKLGMGSRPIAEVVKYINTPGKSISRSTLIKQKAVVTPAPETPEENGTGKQQKKKKGKKPASS
jgi:protein TIF31